MVQLLHQRQEALAYTLGLQFPDLRNTTWQSESSVQAAAQTLTPQMTENKKKVMLSLIIGLLALLDTVVSQRC